MMRNFNLFFALIFGTSLLVPIFCTANNNQTSGEQTDRVMQAFKEKCDNVSNSAYADLEKALIDFELCIDGVFDKTLKEEIQTASQNDKWGPIISKYCFNHTIIFGCFDKFHAAFDGCLKPKEIYDAKLYMNALKNQVNFLCHKDGDRIALFLARKGQDCFDQQLDNVINCFEPAFDRFKSAILDTSIIIFRACDELKPAERCVNKQLEKFENSTPADLVELMFQHFRVDLGCSS